MEGPWKSDSWIVSHFNYAKEVREQIKPPSDVKIYDVTLRDGEQFPGIVFTKEDKVNIAQALDEVGIHRIEAGMPAASDEDFDAVKTISNLGLKAKTTAFSRARRDDIDLALKCDCWGVLIEFPSSDILIEKGFLWTRDRLLNMALDAISYAKDQGLHVTFFPYDTTRADVSFLKHLITTINEKAKPDAVAVVDTFGVASPIAFAHLIRLVKSWVDIPVECHCHNDLGLGTANSIAAVAAGAGVVHTNVNGLGERSGGSATEEVAMALRLLYGLDLGLRCEKFNKLSEIVQNASDVKMPPHKPVVGLNSFAYEAGIPVMFCRRFMEAGFLHRGLPYLPEVVGNKFRYYLGKKSGRHSIRWKLDELGIKASEEEIATILGKVKERAIKKKWALTEEEFLETVEGVVKK